MKQASKLEISMLMHNYKLTISTILDSMMRFNRAKVMIDRFGHKKVVVDDESMGRTAQFICNWREDLVSVSSAI